MIEHSPGLRVGLSLDRLQAFEPECILRIRRGTQWCEASNRNRPTPFPDERRTRAFRTASVTKTFTAALVLRLCEAGLLALSDRLSDHLPAACWDRLQGRSITVHQLLNHRSGLYDYATDARFRAEVLSAPAKRWTPHDLLDAAALGTGAYFEAGTGVAYSDTGYVLLGLIVEAVTGNPLAHAYRQYVFAPLGLQQTYLEGLSPAPDLAVAKAFDGALDTSCFDPSFDAFGGGGLVSTATDLDCFISALMRGRLFARAATLRTLLDGTPTAPGVGTRKTWTACGISEFELAGQRCWGHLGHWNSFMLYQCEADLALCGTFNQSVSTPLQIELLGAALVDALAWEP